MILRTQLEDGPGGGPISGPIGGQPGGPETPLAAGSPALSNEAQKSPGSVFKAQGPVPVDDGALSSNRKRAGPEGSVDFEAVSHYYGDPQKGGATEAVAEFTAKIEPGSLACLLGPSGCGKSTILNLLAGFIKPAGGRVLVGGREVLGPGPDRGVVFQEPNLLAWRKVLGNITLGPDLAGRPKRETLAKARRFIELTGLKGFEGHAPYELSGGMRQRVALARAWISEPPIMVMDEPFGALDAQTRISMQELLLDVWEKTGSTILFVTHDVDEALFLADRLLVMSPRPGRLAKDIPSPLERPRIYESLVVDSRFSALKREILLAMRQPDYAI